VGHQFTVNSAGLTNSFGSSSIGQTGFGVGYDDLGRIDNLADAGTQTTARSFTYDATGNRQSKLTAPSTTTTYGYPARA